jgi:lipopolysaccharide biosynthesis regulator YciM
MAIKYKKLEIYKIKNDNASAVRMIQKLLKKFQMDDPQYLELSVTLAEIYAEQGLFQKSIELIKDLIYSRDYNLNTEMELLIALSNFSLKHKSKEFFLDLISNS